MASSFNGVSIAPLSDGVRRTGGAEVAEQHIPYSDITYITIGGNTLRHLQLTLLFDLQADALAFEDQVGVLGALSVFDGNWEAILTGLERTSRGVTREGPTELRCDCTIVAGLDWDSFVWSGGHWQGP